jgi:hypothetical protein
VHGAAPGSQARQELKRPDQERRRRAGDMHIQPGPMEEVS